MPDADGRERGPALGGEPAFEPAGREHPLQMGVVFADHFVGAFPPPGNTLEAHVAAGARTAPGPNGSW
ncbi:hypothetical protein [Streptomyces sp. MH60]|uniref:hypothetical protein n=1 Tax=Streptomyces sp. MH60 TaxID=1940758 RepID=UPI00406C8743